MQLTCTPSLIITKALDLSIELILSKSFEPFESLKCVTLVPDWNHNPITTEVINECDPIAPFLAGFNRKRTMQVRVDQARAKKMIYAVQL